MAASYNYMGWNISKLITPRVQCTSITNRVFLHIWPFYALIQLYELKYQKTNNSASLGHNYHKSCPNLFDRFAVYFNYMSLHVRKLITPQVLCKNGTKRILSLFDRFTAYYNCVSLSVRKLINPQVLTHVSQNAFLTYLTVLTASYNCMSWSIRKLITQKFCAQVSQNAFLFYSTV